MELPFKITTLLFIRDGEGRFLMLKRRKAPNLGKWSPPGGKLEMAAGESPFECAIREAEEETGMRLGPKDLHLWGMVSEKGYEGTGHWLMFLFRVHPRVEELPAALDEGYFAFYSREAIDGLEVPETDRSLVWPFYDRHKEGFVAYRADCGSPGKLEIEVDQILP